MNPKVRTLLGVVAAIAIVLLIALLIIWVAGRFTGDGEKVSTPPVQDTCSNADCSACCAKGGAGACLDCSKCCNGCKKPAPKYVPKPSPLQQCLAKCDSGKGSACFTSDQKCAVCQASCRGTSVLIQKKVEKKTTVKTKVVHEHEKGTCTDCDTPDIQPNVPGKGPEPSNDTGGGCTSGSCGTGNDFQSNESGGGYEPPN